jgi:hypothetical protein
LAELEVLVGFDDDLAGESTRLTNRIRGLLSQIHPALERAFGKNLTHKAGLELLSRCGGPAGIRKAGRRKLLAIATRNAPRMGEPLVERIMTALDEQTVVVPGTAAAETVLPKLADSLREVLRQRDELATAFPSLAHPPSRAPHLEQSRYDRDCQLEAASARDGWGFATMPNGDPYLRERRRPAWFRHPRCEGRRRCSSSRSGRPHSPWPRPVTKVGVCWLGRVR